MKEEVGAGKQEPVARFSVYKETQEPKRGSYLQPAGCLDQTQPEKVADEQRLHQEPDVGMSLQVGVCADGQTDTRPSRSPLCACAWVQFQMLRGVVWGVVTSWCSAGGKVCAHRGTRMGEPLSEVL